MPKSSKDRMTPPAGIGPAVWLPRPQPPGLASSANSPLSANPHFSQQFASADVAHALMRRTHACRAGTSADAWSFYIPARVSSGFQSASTKPRLMLCIRAWLWPCRNTQSIRGFSPCRLPRCQVRETIAELRRRINQSCFHGVRRNVVPMLHETLPILHARLGKAALPDLSQIAAFLLQTERESSLDELHGPFHCHAVADRQQYMQMVRHDDKVVDPEFPGRHIGAKHVDPQRGIPFRLQQGAALAGLGGGEERTR